MSKTKPNQTVTPMNTSILEPVQVEVEQSEPVSTTAPQGVDIAVIVAQVCENATFKLIQDRLTKIEQSFRDLDSRICEIENFRNTSSIEGKIRDISEKYDEVLQIVGGLKAKLK